MNIVKSSTLIREKCHEPILRDAQLLKHPQVSGESIELHLRPKLEPAREINLAHAIFAISMQTHISETVARNDPQILWSKMLMENQGEMKNLEDRTIELLILAALSWAACLS
jgi:hypothetical protein